MFVEIEITPLGYAAMAIRFFKMRWQREPLYKNATRERNQRKTVTRHPENCRRARMYAKMARDLGWRGSVVQACMRGEPTTKRIGG
jgi:hypothetical protein